MPAWLVVLLVKVVLPIILRDLVTWGMISEAKAIAIKYGIDFEQFLANLKTYPEYPGDPKPPASTNNLHLRQPDEQ